MKPRIEMRLSESALAFEAWDRDRHEAISIPLKTDQPMLVTMLVQNQFGAPRMPDTWSLVLAGGELLIKGPAYSYTQALADGGAEARLNIATLVAACAPDLDLLERMAAPATELAS